MFKIVKLLIVCCFVVTLVNCSIVVRSRRTLRKNCGTRDKSINLSQNISNVTRGEFPWLASIYSIVQETKFICGGSLISHDKVVTAAHCIQDKNQEAARKEDEIILYFGRWNLNETHEIDSVKVGARNILIHPDWDSKDKKYFADIALIVLKSSVSYTKYISPICLPSPIRYLNEKVGVIVKWGQRQESDEHESIPMQFEMPIVSTGVCLNNNFRQRALLTKKMICAGYKNGGFPCTGDSGGGLYLNHNNKWYLHGIISTGLVDIYDTCVNTYGLFTNVLEFSDWIENSLN